MKKKGLILIAMLLLAGCSETEYTSETEAPVIAEELIAPNEYNSIEELLKDIDGQEMAVTFNENIEPEAGTPSNSSRTVGETGTCALEQITTRDVYFCFRYEVDDGDKEYPVEIYTTRGGYGKENLEIRLENNGDLFQEITLSGGKQAYFVEGADLDWFNSYYFLLGEEMVHINMPKEYSDEIDTVYAYVTEEILVGK